MRIWISWSYEPTDGDTPRERSVLLGKEKGTAGTDPGGSLSCPEV